MSDPQNPPISPTNANQTPQPASQEADFFGGGEEAFQAGKVFDPNAPVAEQPAPAFSPNEPTREPTIIEEPVSVEEKKQEEEWVKEEEVWGKEEIKKEAPQGMTVSEKEPIRSVNQSDLGKKFVELFGLTKKIYDLRKSTESFDIIGADNDKIRTVYKFFAWAEEYPLVSITKVEYDKAINEETLHELSFYLNEAGTFLNINLNDELLFDEEADLQDDIKKKMQVTEKINKFIFLLGEEQKKLEKELREKEVEQEEKRKLQDVFKNF